MSNSDTAFLTLVKTLFSLESTQWHNLNKETEANVPFRRHIFSSLVDIVSAQPRTMSQLKSAMFPKSQYNHYSFKLIIRAQ